MFWLQSDERIDRELQKAALFAARSTKRQLKDRRVRAFDDDFSMPGMHEHHSLFRKRPVLRAGSRQPIPRIPCRQPAINDSLAP